LVGFGKTMGRDFAASPEGGVGRAVLLSSLIANSIVPTTKLVEKGFPMAKFWRRALLWWLANCYRKPIVPPSGKTP
jgi:hypothetical protein